MIDITNLNKFNENQLQNYINEATYYGRNANLIEMEKIIDSAREYANKQNYVNFNSELGKLEVLIGKTFGFDEVYINKSVLYAICPQLFLTAGATICQGALYKYTKKVIDGKAVESIDIDTHHKVTKLVNGVGYNFNLVLSTTLFLDRGERTLTSREILAIILHEIGHNFYVGPVKEFASLILCGFIGDISRIELSLLCVALAEGTKDFLYFANNIIPDYVNDSISQFTNTVYIAFAPIIELLSAFGLMKTVLQIFTIIIKSADVLLQRLLSPVTIGRAFLNYDAEKYSDAFASAYGYGTELATGLEKLGMVGMTTFPAINPILKVAKTIISLLFLFIQPVTDEHPNTQARLMNNIKYMKEAGKDISDPVLRKEYEAELKKILKYREEVKVYKGTCPLKLMDKYSAMIQDFIHIGDIKDLTTSLYPKWTKYKNLDL